MALMGGMPIGAFAHSEWQVMHSQNDQWVQETFRRSSDGWQDRVSIRIFPGNSVLRATELETVEGSELRGAAGELWTGKEKWSVPWEEAFSKWVSEETDADFFRKYQVATDCADVLYALRWVFARIHGLEMAVRLTGSGDYLTHRSVRNIWSQLPTASEWFKDQRFLASLNYLLSNTYTHSLMKDSYPIQMDRQGIRPGVYHLDLHDSSGHTQVVYQMDDSGGTILPFVIYQSTTPRLVRELSVDGFWYPAVPQEGKGGLLRMRWPDFSGSKVTLISGEKMPFYSREQYQEGFVRAGQTYNQEVYLRLNPKLDMSQVLLEGYKSLQALFLARIAVVEQGHQVCSQKACPEDSGDYDAWSTPSRDRKISQLDEQLTSIQYRMGLGGPQVEALKEQNFFSLGGATYNLKHLLLIWKVGAYSSDPRKTIPARWGVSGTAAADWMESLFAVEGLQRQRDLDQKKDPRETDLKLSSAYALVSRYCVQAPVWDCEQFQLRLQSLQVPVGSELINLSEALQRVPFMVSLGGISKDRQWGRHSLNYSWLKIEEGEGTLQSEGYYLNVQGSLWKLWQKSPRGGVLLLQGTNSLAALVNQGPSLIVYSQGRISAYDLKKGSSTQMPISFQPTGLKSYGNGFLIFSQITKQFSLGFINQDQIQWLDQGQARWLPASASSSYNDNFSRKAFIYGASAGSRIWDLSGTKPKGYVSSYDGPGDIGINTDRMMVIFGGGIFLKRSGSFVSSGDAMRAISCHPSGLSCILVSSNGGYEFATVGSDGQFFVKKIFKGNIYVGSDRVTLFIRPPSGSKMEIFDWAENNLNAHALASDEVEFLSGYKGLVSAKLKSGGVRIRKGNQILLEKNLLALYFVNERFVEAFDSLAGRLWLYDLQDSAIPLANPIYRENRPFISAPDVGAVTGSGLWIQ